jgi:hypothetical protein
MMPKERQEKDDWNRYSEKPKQGTTTEAHCDLLMFVSGVKLYCPKKFQAAI